MVHQHGREHAREYGPEAGTPGPLSLDLGTIPAAGTPAAASPGMPGPAGNGSRPHPVPPDGAAGAVAPPAAPSGPPASSRPPTGSGSSAGSAPPGDPAPAGPGPGPQGPDRQVAGRGTTRSHGDEWRGALIRLLDRVSLQARLVAVLTVALVVALGAMGYGVQFLLRGYLIGQIDSQLTTTTDHASGNRHLLSGLVSGEVTLYSELQVQLTLDSSPNKPTAASHSFGEDTPAFPTVTSTQAAALDRHVYTVTAGDGSKWRAASIPITVEGTGQPGAVTVLEPLRPVDRAVAKLRFLSLVFGLGVTVLCTMLGWLAILRAFVPLREVEDTAAAIAAGDLSRRVPEHPGSTEVGRLTASLNGMLAQIEQAFRHREASEARTRRFAADASHELRTPLASIRGFAELYRQGAVPVDEVPRTMRRIEDEATRMGGLVEDLLLLARLDEQRAGRSEPVDLAVLANDAVHDAHGLDATRRISLIGLGTAGGPSPAVVIGDEDRLRQVVANLMANAVRHTPPGTSIEVAVGISTEPDDAGRRTPRAVLEVRDHGRGLTPEQAERVFERFYRVDSSRSRGQGGGSGLGLSIVAAVISAHRGRVETRTTPGGGATFRVEIPAAPPGTSPG